ncbi:DUF4258 domain-containing protein [Rhodococcus koreensis]|uniref:DUF4258 domain-containing protein n=1 Tax=Rhodococcus koreensis TaxID=99653 RepID=UPI00197CBEB7|nr:DUF4258 domain-containing protein [Rhodococcus koreensis]QSE86571.1 DUF4258 domain-containing protein [Rhodococcus koreensis]
MSPTTPPERWTYTHHLRQRALERGITDSEIRTVLDDPEVTYSQSRYGPTRQVRQRGDLGIIVDTDSRAVITVLFRAPERWIAGTDDRTVAA